MRVNTSRSKERTTLRGARGRRFGAVLPPADLLANVQPSQVYNFEALVAPPASVDLRGYFPPVYDQGNTNSCTACTAAGMIAYLRGQQGLPPLSPSRSFIYFYDRLLNHIAAPDGGGSVLAALQAATQYGYCAEAIWPFVPAHFGTQPSAAASADANHHHSSGPVPVTSLANIRDTLARGYPVGIALLIYNSFYAADANGGTVQTPGPNEGYIRHAGVLVGYRPDGYLIFRNSWGLVNPQGGPNGDQGHYYLPPAYFQGSLVYECYAIQSVAET